MCAALERLRRSKKTKTIPVVALSANAMASDVKKGRRAGFRDYLTKPIKVEEVLAAIDDALSAPKR
jgi:CheY-like chemotaxis protein